MKDLTEVLLDELLKDYQTPEQILGENGILKQLTKRLAERALQAEMTHHLGYAKHDYQSKANKETLDNFINHNTDDEPDERIRLRFDTQVNDQINIDEDSQDSDHR